MKWVASSLIIIQLSSSSFKAITQQLLHSNGNIHLWPERLSVQYPLTFQNWSHNHHMLVESYLTLLANSFLKQGDKKIQISNALLILLLDQPSPSSEPSSFLVPQWLIFCLFVFLWMSTLQSNPAVTSLMGVSDHLFYEQTNKQQTNHTFHLDTF